MQERARCYHHGRQSATEDEAAAGPAREARRFKDNLLRNTCRNFSPLLSDRPAASRPPIKPLIP